jgi:hypothetical protein
MPVKKVKSFQIPLDVPVSEPHSQTHYLAPEPVAEVAPVAELELNKNYETDPEFQKNMEQDFDKLLSLDFKPVKKSKPRKLKKVVEPVVVEPVVVEPVVVKKPRKQKKVVEVITDSDSEPEVKEPEPEPKLKKSNAWVQHIRAFALEHGIGYNKAMIHPDLKKSYIKASSNGGKVSL